MAIPLSTIENKALEGIKDDVTYADRTREYFYQAFKAKQSFLLQNPHFHWRMHIDQTFYDRMTNTLSRFLEVN